MGHIPDFLPFIADAEKKQQERLQDRKDKEEKEAACKKEMRDSAKNWIESTAEPVIRRAFVQLGLHDVREFLTKDFAKIDSEEYIAKIQFRLVHNNNVNSNIVTFGAKTKYYTIYVQPDGNVCAVKSESLDITFNEPIEYIGMNCVAISDATVDYVSSIVKEAITEYFSYELSL